MSAIAERLARTIAALGPVSIASFMGEANAQYYAKRDPLGANGDFITAPEISQMFGEMIGLWCADLWLRAGSPADWAWVELGPGRGTLAADALRAMRRHGAQPAVHMVETSPVLRAAQSAQVPGVVHYDDVTRLPGDRPLIIIANEFFDALPIRQLVRDGAGWRERMVTCGPDGFAPTVGTVPMDALIPAPLRRSQPGTIIEMSPASIAIMQDISARIAGQGGAALIIDYGYEGPAAGDTLQALKAHRSVDAFAMPGEADLTAHVDFAALAAAARTAGARVSGPVGQGEWLQRMGIDQRMAALCRSSPGRADQVTGQRHRLVNADQMGQLFRVMAVHAGTWPQPEGFAA